MASKLDQARTAAANARKRAKDARVEEMLFSLPAGYLYGSAHRTGVNLPNVGGIGRHATCGIIASAIALNTTGMPSKLAGSLGKAGLTLAGFELGATGAVIAGDDDDDDADEEISG